MTKLDKIRNMAYFLVPTSAGKHFYDFENITGRFNADPENRIDALKKTSRAAMSKSYSCIVLALNDNPMCYVHFTNGEDTYGRGDYNTVCVSFEPNGKHWGPATEDFLEYYFTNILTGVMKDSVTKIVLDLLSLRIEDQVTKLIKKVARYGKVKDSDYLSLHTASAFSLVLGARYGKVKDNTLEA